MIDTRRSARQARAFKSFHYFLIRCIAIESLGGFFGWLIHHF